jgi:putative DNA primase/helicase
VIKRLHIAVDYDPAGERAAEACAARWQKAGREVVLHRAATPGEDLNDVIRRGAS